MLNSPKPNIIYNRVWAMPNKHTFKIKPIKELVDRYVGDGVRWIDPFAGYNSPCAITNDINPDAPTIYHEEAVDFLKRFDSCKGIIYDPPYSVRQISECYKKYGLKVTQETTQAKWYKNVKDEIARIYPEYIISCGWNSGGVGKTNGYNIIEILLVPHGGIHNDTIVTVEQRNISGDENK